MARTTLAVGLGVLLIGLTGPLASIRRKIWRLRLSRSFCFASAALRRHTMHQQKCGEPRAEKTLSKSARVSAVTGCQVRLSLAKGSAREIVISPVKSSVESFVAIGGKLASGNSGSNS